MKFIIACLTILICLPSLARYETHSVIEDCGNSPETFTFASDERYYGRDGNLKILNTENNENELEVDEGGRPGGNI